MPRAQDQRGAEGSAWRERLVPPNNSSGGPAGPDQARAASRSSDAQRTAAATWAANTRVSEPLSGAAWQTQNEPRQMKP